MRDVRKSDRTRQKILDAAAAQFARLGYAHTTLSDIAKEAGSYAGGIYYYFTSRDDLVSAVLEISTNRSIELLTSALDALPEDASAAEQIRAAIIAQLKGIMSGDAYNLAHNRIYPQAPKEIRDRHREDLRKYFMIWRRIIARGQERGEIDPTIDPAVLRLTISGSIQWAAEWASADHGSPEALGEKMSRIFLDSILLKN